MKEKGKGGKISINYQNHEELEKILKLYK
ncbi:MAG: hypothetical protein ACR2FM_01385 [Candidatus Saccharimonadales bacterium]